MTQTIPYNDIKFYAITSFAVLMHMKTPEQLKKSLKNINEALEMGGYFLWYDPNDKHHFSNRDSSSDGEGYSIKEMKKYAREAGFVEVYTHGLYRVVSKRNTLYFADRVQNRLLDFLNSLLVVFPYGYNICLFKKADNI